MRARAERCKAADAVLTDDGLMVHETRDETAIAERVAYGETPGAFQGGVDKTIVT